MAITFLVACGGGGDKTPQNTNSAPSGNKMDPGLSAVRDPNSKPTVLQVALDSKDHTTLVAAVKAASYADSLANPGPFTVFAPTNAAFDKLPKGTVEGLLKPEKLNDLKTILEHHVYVGVIETKVMTDGMVLGQASGSDVKITVKDGKFQVDGANILGSVRSSNGVVHVIDAVLLPTAKK